MSCPRGRLVPRRSYRRERTALCEEVGVHHGLWSEATVLSATKAQSSSSSYKEVGQGDTLGASGWRIRLTSALCPQSFTYLLEFSPNLVGLRLVFPRSPVSCRLLGVSDDAECIS